jgi:hypothetical protein
MVDDNEIRHVLNVANELVRSVRDLAGKAFSGGARDNVSLIIVSPIIARVSEGGSLGVKPA